MYQIIATEGKNSYPWCDPCIRGNCQPMQFHDRLLADKECDMLNLQYYNEGYSFHVLDFTPVTT